MKEKLHICTTGDSKFFLNGMALWHSLVNTIGRDGFVLHWLCLDQKNYDSLTSLNIKSIVPYNLADLEAADPELVVAKSNPASLYGTQYSQYCWCLTPYFTYYILQKVIQDGQQLIYCDNDIAFYHSPQLILKAVGEKSVGIHRHRFSGAYNPKNPVGEFNVGVMVFKKDEAGMQVIEQWKGWLLDPRNKYYKQYGTCGDQKYLDLFIPLFGEDNICVFDDEHIGYIAPWASDNVSYLDNNFIIHKGKKQPMVFCHFSHFRYDLERNKWYDSYNGEWNPTRLMAVRIIYENYYQTIKDMNDFVFLKNA